MDIYPLFVACATVANAIADCVVASQVKPGDLAQLAPTEQIHSTIRRLLFTSAVSVPTSWDVSTLLPVSKRMMACLLMME